MLIAGYFGAFAASAIAAPPPSSLPEDEPLPAPNNIINVSSQSQLTSAVSSVSPGDHIVLANSSYGSVTFDRDFPTNNRLVIRAANLHGATFNQMTIRGDGYIVSGVHGNRNAVTGFGFPLWIIGSSVRFTRGLLENGQSCATIGDKNASPPKITNDAMIDHCELRNFNWRCVNLSAADNVRRPILARNWFHHGLNNGGGPDGVLLSAVAFGSENVFREEPVDGIVRLNYFGPVLQRGDWIHNKSSDNIYAFNRFEGDNNYNRFGLRVMFIGNYQPGGNMQLTDYDNWAFGNLCANMNVWGGNSRFYDETDNAIFWNGIPGNTSIFHAARRIRLAGNNVTTDINLGRNESFWCGWFPISAGGLGIGGTVGGVTYQADDPDHPDNGVKIRDQAGTTIISSTNDCNPPWVQNLDSQVNTAAPAVWLSDLPSWITDIVADPTDLSASPWSLAQALTRGDAATPNTGPHRDSPGGLLP